MALRNQPYLPLYVQDYLTDEKLNECSASSQGIYIKIMCLMHKSDEYGTILLKQKDKQTSNQIENFAYKLVKHLPFSFDELNTALKELIDEDVLQLDANNYILSQKRMIKDNNLSNIRSNAGSKGGKKTQFAKAKVEANTEYESESENEFEIDSFNNKIDFDVFWDLYDKKVGSKPKLEKKWDKLKEQEQLIILKHIELYKISQPDKQFRKNPETYLNNKSWNDEIIGVKNGTSKKFNTAISESELREFSESIFNDPRYK